MRALATLIRLHRQYLDEKRSRLMELEIERGALCARADRLCGELDTEGQVAASSYEAGRAFPRYAKRVAIERRAIDKRIAALDAEIAEHVEAVADTYREVKGYEISREQREKRATMAAARSEQTRLDEVGLAVHRRKQAS